MENMIKTVQQTIEKYNMIQKGDGVIVGVSGGPDSICLLHILYQLQELYQIRIYAVHINHGLRGQAADADAAYVENICNRFQIPIYVKEVDIKKIAKQRNISEEVAGREERYKFFTEIAEEMDVQKIAVAQNQQDQAETVLMRFLRGSGLEGLTGIRPNRQDGIIRPLIGVDRQSIERYCEIHQLHPHIDATNLKPIYTRNKIRLELLPYLQKEYNPNIVQTLITTADIMREDNDFFENYVNNIGNREILEQEGVISIPISFLLAQHAAIQRRLIRKLFERLKGNVINIEYKHITDISKMIQKEQTGLYLTLPGNIRAEVVYDKLCIYHYLQHHIGRFEYLVHIGKKIFVKEVDMAVEAMVIDRQALQKITLNNFTKAFDYNAINEELYIRNRLDGDKFIPSGMNGTKKLKDFFIDLKIPRNRRNRIPLLATRNDILWVIGYRTNEKYRCTKNTQDILVIKISGGIIQ